MQLAAHRLVVAAGHPLNSSDFITGDSVKEHAIDNTGAGRHNSLSILHPLYVTNVQFFSLQNTHVPLLSSLQTSY